MDKTDEELSEGMSPADRQLITAYQKVFLGSAEGQLVFWDLMDRCFLFRPFGQQNANAYALEGKREVALKILAMVELAPSLGRPNHKQMEQIKRSLDMTHNFKVGEEDVNNE